MSKIWLLAANSSMATLFSADSATGPLAEVETFANPEAREKESDLSADRPGRSFDSKGEGRHAMEPVTPAKEQVQIRFAKLLADTLERGRVAHAFERLVLVAAPSFLGLLRANLDAPLQAAVSLELDKDFTALRPEELRARLPQRL